MNTKVRPRCFGEFNEANTFKRSTVCFACFALKDCKANPKNGTNTTLQVQGQAQDNGPQVAAQWEAMWQEAMTALNSDPNLQPVVQWLENFKKQRVG